MLLSKTEFSSDLSLQNMFSILSLSFRHRKFIAETAITSVLSSNAFHLSKKESPFLVIFVYSFESSFILIGPVFDTTAKAQVFPEENHRTIYHLNGRSELEFLD